MALALDLTLRAEGRGTLDDVMRRLWHDSGAARVHRRQARSTKPRSRRRCAPWPAARMERELRAWVHGTDDLPWAALLRAMGVSTSHESPPTLAALLGLRVAEGRSAACIV